MRGGGSEAELFALIFQPGFSTAQTVTNVSGRGGVGMDVVKRSLEALRGTIEVASTLGQGTTITLKLPLTLAIIDGLLVRVGPERYVLPRAVVEECVELARERTCEGCDVLNLRGMVVPFLRLRTLFTTQTPPEPIERVVIVAVAGRRIGLVVDQVIGQHQTVIKPLSRLHGTTQAFSGATILGDGSVALILDVSRLAQSADHKEAA